VINLQKLKFQTIVLGEISHHWWSNKLATFFFFETFYDSIGLNLYWSPILEALLYMKKKSNKDTTKCSQYKMIITMINELQKSN